VLVGGMFTGGGRGPATARNNKDARRAESLRSLFRVARRPRLCHENGGDQERYAEAIGGVEVVMATSDKMASQRWMPRDR